MTTAKPTRRRHRGERGITWLDPRTAKLRARVGGKQYSRTVHLEHAKAKGGTGEASDALDGFIAELTGPEPATDDRAVDEDTVTVAKALSEYVSQCKRVGRAQSTLENYDEARQRIPDDLGALPCGTSRRTSSTRFTGSWPARLAPNTVRQTHAFLSAAFNQAEKWGWLGRNPASRATTPQKHIPEREPLNPADVARLDTAAEVGTARRKSDIVLAMAVVLAAVTGARRGELCGLQWGDLDTKTGVLTVQRQLVPGIGGQREEPTTKTGKPRTVNLGALGLDVVERYRVALRTLVGREPAGWLLSDDSGATPLRAKA